MIQRPPRSTLFPYTTALPILSNVVRVWSACDARLAGCLPGDIQDRKSTRLNSSHSSISYAVFCLKKKRWRVVDVWESEEALDKFFQEKLGQALQEAGLATPQP